MLSTVSLSTLWGIQATMCSTYKGWVWLGALWPNNGTAIQWCWNRTQVKQSTNCIMLFHHGGWEICRKTFQKLHGIGMIANIITGIETKYANPQVKIALWLWRPIFLLWASLQEHTRVLTTQYLVFRWSSESRPLLEQICRDACLSSAWSYPWIQARQHSATTNLHHQKS